MSQMTIEQAIALGWQHHQSARYAEAESVYRQILAAHPNHPDALHMLGVLAAQVGRADVAIELIGQAIRLNPSQGGYYSNYGHVLTLAGRLDEAITSLEHAVKALPAFAQAFINLGNAYIAAGRFAEAAEQCRRAIAIDPKLTAAYNNLGNALRSQGIHDEAIHAYRTAILLHPNFAEAHYNLAITLKDQNLLPDAAEEMRRALELRPIYPEAHNNLGNIHQLLGQLVQAEQHFRSAIAQRPDLANAHSNLANVLRDQGRFDEASQSYHRAMQLKPQWHLPRYNYSLTLLLKGDFANGWREYESRLKSPEIGATVPHFSQPMWDGSELAGRKILVHAEQGFGDAIQFVRYLPIVASRGGKVLLQCQDELLDLFRTVDGIDDLIPQSQTPTDFDLHCPLLSLPYVLKTDSLESIPAKVPYLYADPLREEQWRLRLANAQKRFKIGLAWAGRATHPNDRNRSIKLSSLAEALFGADAAFFSMQKGPASAEIAELRPGFDLVDVAADLHTFADTAALIAQLDLVITVDTAVAHLAGAMGRPVWVLLPWIPDWRWLLDRADSPWYPTMTLYRQPAAGDYQTPIQRITNDLNLHLKRNS